MNIAVLSQALPYLPSRGGFRLYGANLIRTLSKRHEIHLVSLLENDDVQHLEWPRRYCTSVSTIPVNAASFPQRLANFVSATARGRPTHNREPLAATLQTGTVSHKWEVLHVEGGFVGGLVQSDLSIAKVLSLHDSWTLRCDEMLHCAQSVSEKLYYRLLKFHEPRYERMVYPRFERCVVVAEPDLQAVRKTVPNARVNLIPYGTDTEYFNALPVQKEKNTLVFHSHLGYAPNVEAALEFAHDVFPIIRQHAADAVFHLIGADPDRKVTELASRPGIRISPNLPDLRAAVCSGQVYVCPIRHGTGLKSKMLEAMAMRMPIVGYPGAIVGLDGVPGKHYLVAQDPIEFAAHVVDLLQHPERAEALAIEGRNLVENKYSWESRARAYEELYQRVIEERKVHQGSNGRH